MILESAPYYTHSFGSMGTTLATARETGFFKWFHMAEIERRQEEPGELVRFRPSGDKFHDLCFLDVLMAPGEVMVRMELVVERSFLDGADGLFAQDLMNSFLHAALPDACQSLLEDFIAEINTPGGDGNTAAFQVFKGRRNDWSTQTGWSRLHFANLSVAEIPSLVVNVGANPEAPNAKLVSPSHEQLGLERKREDEMRRRRRIEGIGWAVVAIACGSLIWIVFGRPSRLFLRLPAFALEGIHRVTSGSYAGAAMLTGELLIAVALLSVVLKLTQK